MKTIHRIGVIGLVGFLGWAAVPVAADNPLTAEQVVARCAEAMGGAEKISALKTLRLKIAYADRPLPVITEIKRPNRIRSEADTILVFNGKRAGWLRGAPSADGKEPGPQLLPVEEGKDFEVDIAFLFPAFFDYPPEYMGLATVEGIEFHQVGVVLPLGIRMTYFLDAKTLLPTKIVADIPHQGKVYRPEHAVGDYERTDGILFPRTSTATGWGPKGRAAIESVEVNVPLGDDRFEMPAGSTIQTPDEPRQATVPFTLDHNRMMVEAQFVRPDGTPRKARAWVDTGSQHLVVAEPLARDLGLDLSGLRKDGTQDSADSSSPAPSVRLGGLPLDMKGIKVRVFPGTNLRAGVSAEAMLPASAFRHDHVVFDYPALRMTVARPGTLRPRGTAVPCRVNPETGLFQIAAVLDGESVQMGVDNGSAGTWVSEALTAAWQARHPDWPHATGALGSANFFGFPFETQGALMRLPELRIGTLSARDVAVLGLPQGLFDWYSQKSAGAVAGFIGANILRGFRLEVDFPNGMTYWEAGPPPGLGFGPGDLDIVGLTLRPEAGGAYTIAGVAMKDGKAAVGGVQPGDGLIRVDALDAQGALMGQVVDALRGKPGATRTLVIERDGKRLTVETKAARFP